MQLIRQLADWRNPRSMGNRLRSKRMNLFARMIAPLPKPVRIIDIGGTTAFWEHRGWTDRRDVAITVVNLKCEPQRYPHIESKSGDATNLSEFPDKSFDVVFSNSVIEHLSTFENQAAMAREVQRVARAYWVQTPNYWFPIEPHFHILGWQWMPRIIRVKLLQRYRCGWRGPCPDRLQAERLVDEVRLMSRRELQKLFPDASIRTERFCGLSKSFIAYDGFGLRV